MPAQSPTYKFDPDQLILGGMGLIFFIAGMAVMLIFGNSVTLECSRGIQPEPACLLRSRTLIRTREQSIPIRELTGAVVDVSYGEDGKTYRVVLQTTRGTIPLTGYYSSGARAKQQITDQVNAFLRYGTMQSLSLEQDDSIWVAIFSGIFVGAGILQIFFAVRKMLRTRFADEPAFE